MDNKKNSADLAGCSYYPPRPITPSSICGILHILLSLIQSSVIAKCISRLIFFRLYTSTCVKIATCVSPCSHVEIFMLFQNRMRDFSGSKCYRFRVGRGAIMHDWKKTPSQWRVYEPYYRQTSELIKVKPQAAQTWYVSLNEYINIHMDKLMRWVVETPMD